MPFTVLVAPSGLKGSLTPIAAARAMARGIATAAPGATILEVPVPDGGEGFAECLARVTGGSLERVVVCAPLGGRVDAAFALFEDPMDAEPTAAIEIAAAAGLSLMRPSEYDVMRATSRGVGELILAALDRGARRLLVGCGDSGVNDAGMGLMQALGARVLDENGQEVAPGGAGLTALHTLDLTNLDPRLAGVGIEVAVNPGNALLGPRGVARVYGPQKGARPRDVEILSEALDRFAALVERTTGRSVATLAGSGASGGLGAAFAGLLDARLTPRYDVILRYLDLDRILDRADLVLTAEGALDAQTPNGKVPAEVGRRAKARGIPVVALAGVLGPGCESALDAGIDAFASLLPGPLTLEEAMNAAPALLCHATENIVRAIMVGQAIGSRRKAGMRRRAAVPGPVRGFSEKPGNRSAPTPFSLV
jgi:glycerate kinase